MGPDLPGPKRVSCEVVVAASVLTGRLQLRGSPKGRERGRSMSPCSGTARRGTENKRQQFHGRGQLQGGKDTEEPDRWRKKVLCFPLYDIGPLS